ncbi:MAG TPA: hypothetical protein VGY54_05530 [Polyangiaceae bacterium]|jgi:hypothetical protein|nr:hypothetical protein [Polyangiaceae bacterium]
MLKVPLNVAGSSQRESVVHYSAGLRLYVAPVADERPEKARIGSNHEGIPAVPVVADGTPPTDFVGKILTSELSGAGAHIAPDAASANRVLSMRLVRFFAEEGGMYESDVGAIAEVRDPAGQSLYSYSVTGQAKQWGRSLSPDNYNEVFTRAVFDLAKHLVEQPEFQNALNVGNDGASHSPPPDGGAKAL